MSAGAFTPLASLIGVVGVLSGLVVERLLRSVGNVWCEPTDWETHLLDRTNETYEGRKDIDWARPEDATHAGYSVWLDLYNGKEIPVGLRDISIVFHCDAGELVSKPLSTTSGRQVGMGSPVSYATMRNINLSPRDWVSVVLHNVSTDPKEISIMAGWRRAQFVGHRHKRGLRRAKPYRGTIATRDE